jgi:CMP-N-acetylneuraminic acid synthetase
MSALAIIPARGGSKGIPKKNLLMIGGKPLIAWSIEAAKACPEITHVVVTSDDDEILQVAEQYGAEVLKRPAELATDTAHAAPVLQHALVESKKKYGTLPRWVVYLQPTSPLRTVQHLTEAFNMLNGNPTADALIGVYEADNLYLKTSIANADGFLEYASRPEFANMNRQMLPKLYKPNGAMYIMDAESCIDAPRFDGERTLPFVMSREDSVDVDTLEDIPPIERALGARVSA